MTWIETFTGKRLDLLEPSPDDIDIVDIAHALSQLCRFTGHCSRFYSVAEHSIWVCKAVMREVRESPTTLTPGEREAPLQALLHDATEAYVADVSRPAKLAMRAIARGSKRSEVPGFNAGSSYDVLEDRIWRVVAAKFSLPPKMSPLIKEMDQRMLATEHALLMRRGDWNLSYEPVLLNAVMSAPTRTCAEVTADFLRLFAELTE